MALERALLGEVCPILEPKEETMSGGSFRLALAVATAVAVAGCGSGTTRPTLGSAYGSIEVTARKASQTYKGEVLCVKLTLGGLVWGLLNNSDPGNAQGEWRVLAQHIAPGSYTISVEAYDGASDGATCTGRVLYSNIGSEAHIDVLANQTTTAQIWLAEVIHVDAFHNTAPFISSLVVGSRSVTPGVTISLEAMVEDPDVDAGGQPLTFAWVGEGAFADSASRATSWTAPLLPGDYPLTITATDSAGASASATVTIQVGLPTGLEAIIYMNAWPVVRQIVASYPEAVVGEPITFTVIATDDEDGLTYRWSVAGESCGGTPGQTAATASFTPSGIGFCTVSVEVMDLRGGTGTGSLAFQVGAPTIVEGPPVSLYWLSSNVIFNPDGTKRAEVAALTENGASTAWSDGGAGGHFSGYDGGPTLGDAYDVWYTPPTCVHLGGGGAPASQYVIPLTVTVTSATTLASNSVTTNMTVMCQAGG